MCRVAAVFVNIPIKSIAKAYTYLIPTELDHISAGWRVLVPFGGRQVEGFVIAVDMVNDASAIDNKIKLKPIIATVDEEGWFSERMLKIATKLADFYLCSLAEMMRLFMPGKSGVKIAISYQANPQEVDHLLLNMAAYKAVYDCLVTHGSQTKTELGKHLPELKPDLVDILNKLTQYKVILKDYVATSRDKAHYERLVQLTAELTPEVKQGFKRRPAQLKLLELLAAASNQQLTVPELKNSGISTAIINTVVAAGLASIKQQRILRDSYRETVSNKKDLELTADQKNVIATVQPYLQQQSYQGFLLQGVTGSGKTQVYIELAKLTRQAGRQVIVLVPEIALTGQVVQAFKAYFSQDIVVMHSRLSLAERNDAIIRVRRNEAGVIIGARSALFTPVADVGLIIMDEEQDMSYKQDESPRYHAKVVAQIIAEQHNASLVLGSATPSLETSFKARHGELVWLKMPKRIGNRPLPTVKCVDMRQELKMGNRHITSRPLHELIVSTLNRGEQLIIMLNRRGFSTFVMCRSCGEVIKCKLCGLPLVYHKSGRLTCHHCDVNEPVPNVCPKCGSRYIKYFGSGTEKLEQELHEIVPQARIIRMDRDTTNSKFAHQEILAKFRRHEYDILLGTQMVAKGHDIPNVTAVGIISADSALNMPDFRASERCFMLITQTAGRAGRHTSRGQVVIQTYNPQHYAVTCGIAQDYDSFYEQDLKFRQQLFYPPFSRLIKLLFQNENEAVGKANAIRFIEHFNAHFAKVKTQQIVGPSPAMIACLRGVYRFVVQIKTADISAVQAFLRQEKMHVRPDVAIDIDPINIL